MTTTQKAVNYTTEQTAELLALYAANQTVADIANIMGKTTRSIIAKLARAGVYQKKEYVSKTGAKPMAKEAFVDEIAVVLGVSAENLGGLEKANKTTLELILKGLIR